MKINSNTKIIGEKVLLVPYEEKHVPNEGLHLSPTGDYKKFIYHDWMSSEDLLRLTASEPLSLEEEYEMQKNWRNDNDKCTFIVLNKGKYAGPETEIEAMVGDINFFLTEEQDGLTGEVNMMIADESVRRGGLGTETLFLMIRYGLENLNLRQVRAKIGIDNEPSILMFTKHGFKEVTRSDIFKEVTLALNLEDDVLTKIMALTEGYREEKYK